MPKNHVQPQMDFIHEASQKEIDYWESHLGRPGAAQELLEEIEPSKVILVVDEGLVTHGFDANTDW